jgi:hypothetical protein
MKIVVTMKTPEALDYAMEHLDFDPDDAADIVSAIEKKFMEYGEYLRVEFDTTTMTATVLENK